MLPFAPRRAPCLLLLALLAASAVLSGCGLVASVDAIEGEYVASSIEGDAQAAWRGTVIVLRDGAGTLAGPAGTQELAYELSDTVSPWITVTLADGSSLQLQYRRPGELSTYDRTGGVVRFRRVSR